MKGSVGAFKTALKIRKTKLVFEDKYILEEGSWFVHEFLV